MAGALKLAGLTPYLVFDGPSLPVKDRIHSERLAARGEKTFSSSDVEVSIGEV